MPPQPLSRVKVKCQIRFEWDSLSSQPLLATQVAHVISIWSYADVIIAQILAGFLRADHYIVMAMFQAIASAEARRDVLHAAAKEALSGEDHLLFTAVMRVTAASRRRRNEFAHHVWGRCPEIPDTALLAPPNVVGNMLLTPKVPSGESQDEKLKQAEKIAASLDRSQILVYREKDLFEEAVSANDAAKNINCLAHVLTGTPWRDEMRSELLKQSEIQQQLEKFSK